MCWQGYIVILSELRITRFAYEDVPKASHVRFASSFHFLAVSLESKLLARRRKQNGPPAAQMSLAFLVTLAGLRCDPDLTEEWIEA